jgi:hypothetical protein
LNKRILLNGKNSTILTREIGRILENSIKNCSEGYKANAKVYDKARDDAECQASVQFLDSAIQILWSAELEIVLDNVFQEDVANLDLRQHSVKLTMNKDTTSPVMQH